MSLIYRKNHFLFKIKRNIDPLVIFADNLSHYFNLYGENLDVGHLLVIVCHHRLTIQFVTHTILTVPTLLRQNRFFYIGKYDSKKLLTKLWMIQTSKKPFRIPPPQKKYFASFYIIRSYIWDRGRGQFNIYVRHCNFYCAIPGIR